MNDAREIYTLPAEAAAARLRELLTTEKPPSSGTALKARLHQPPSEIVANKYIPYERRMWSPEGIDRWCAERQPPRMRKALACLARLESLGRMAETLEAEHGLDFRFVFTHGPHDLGGIPESLADQMGTVEKTLVGILTSAAGDEHEPKA